ncbi:MAG TPA: hypothetical protein VF808_09125 [Ktedonobacterales bacterium]
MRQRIVLGAGGAVLLALGLVIGVIVGPSLQALAAGGQARQATKAQVAKGDYCALYEQTVAADLNVSQSQLESANKDALQKVINQLYADGKITQAQKTKAEQELSQYASNPCAALKAIQAQRASGQGANSASLSTARASILTATAKALGLTSAALQTKLASGMTVAQVTAAQHAQKSGVDAAYLAAVQGLLKRAVTGGAMSQSQADLAYSYIQGLVAQGHYPLLDKGGENMQGFGAGQ